LLCVHLSVITTILGNFFLVLGVARASERYHRFMLDSVLKSPMSFFDTTPVGRIINRYSNSLHGAEVSPRRECLEDLQTVPPFFLT
ncbi:hypothetical protein AVEN_83934-1, partial [Araneus ventricosus]